MNEDIKQDWAPHWSLRDTTSDGSNDLVKMYNNLFLKKASQFWALRWLQGLVLQVKNASSCHCDFFPYFIN